MRNMEYGLVFGVKWGDWKYEVRMYQHYPSGKRLPALEKNILKYRAFEMMLVIYYVEHLKKFVSGSIELINELAVRDNIGRTVKKRMDDFLLEEGILSAQQVKELRTLLSTYRNEIAHDIHNLTYDIALRPDIELLKEHRGIIYDYSALQKLKEYKKLVSERISRKFACRLSSMSYDFETAKLTYEEELSRLAIKIKRQFKARHDETTKLQAELDLPDYFSTDEWSTGHPLNKTSSGKLTDRGITILHRLLELGKSPLAISYLMRISLSTSQRHLKKWRESKKNVKQQ